MKKIRSQHLLRPDLSFGQTSTAYSDSGVTLTYDLPYAVEYDDGNLTDYMKLIRLRAAENYESFPEKLICYVNLLAGLHMLSFIVFVNLKSVLSDEELHAFYEHCRNEKISLLLVESGKVRPVLKEERAVIITNDLCEITENFGSKY